MYDEYYPLVLRCSSIWDLRHKPFMWEKVVHFLRTRDSNRCADCWMNYWQGPWTLADCGYANCTHQNSQEGTWRPVKRGTGCGAKGDERQALGSFTSQLVQYVRTASEDHEQKLIKQGRPNAFVREPSPVKADWDALQNMHPKAMVCSMPLGVGRKMTAEETSAFGELISDLFYTHPRCEPVYLHIQKFHAAKLENHLESGELEENFKCRIRERLLDKIIMPSNKLMYTVDPKGSRKLNHVMRDLQPYFRAFIVFCDQHLECNRAEVDGWSLEEYLQANENFHVLTRIVKADESWGELKFKCNCKRCFIHCCCAQSLAWSMVLNPKLVMPPKYAKLAPYLRKKKGRPTAKRIEFLKAQQADARPFVDKAKTRVSM